MTQVKSGTSLGTQGSRGEAPCLPAPILVVDDDDEIREVMKTILELEGYRVIEARDGAEALELLRGSTRPDLILLDLMMPVMDGREFRERQRKDPLLGAIPVVLVSAFSLADANVAAMGAVGYLRKPFELETLLEIVARERTSARRASH